MQTELEASHKERSQSLDYLQERLRSHDQPLEWVYGAMDEASVRIKKAKKRPKQPQRGLKWKEDVA